MPSAHAWYLTDDLDDFLTRAGDFLRSRPALHTVPLTVTDALRSRGPHVYGAENPLYGVLGSGPGPGGVRAILLHTPPHPLNLTPLAPEEAESLAALLLARGHQVPGVSAAQDTAAAFTAAWERASTGATGSLRQRQRLYRLGELTVPEPVPEGRARVAGPRDRELVRRWYEEFAVAVGQSASAASSAEWADSRIGYGGVTLWETPDGTPDGTPVAMAGVTRQIAGQVRVAPVYTPSHLRGRGYAGAVTAVVSRAAQEAGAAEVLLFTDLANPTSNGLYQRIGYRPVADFSVYGFGVGREGPHGQ
ncbi:GNAT family N-acetyltransferase [Streptomyces sp. NPDC056161]|uniref:GNAT family N-acetyltransferase n=1 Tax=Streptomyces sp. NPDC056161 TaxID=3345732 RepID=UPI0035D67AB6